MEKEMKMGREKLGEGEVASLHQVLRKQIIC